MRKFTILFVLLLLGGMQIVFAQKTITGKVTNKEDGLGLPGATIAVTGTTIATITDVLGKYSLQVPANATSLHFTFIGMKPLDVSIGDQKEINVTLELEITALDEIVVVGYTSRKLSQLSSSVSVISSKKLQDVTSNNVTDLLQGKAPGIVVSSATGDPNATPSIIIRGTS